MFARKKYSINVVKYNVLLKQYNIAYLFLL